MGFPERLRLVIKKSGLKREEFAEHAGKSRGQLFKYLGGESTPTADFFQAIKRDFPWVNIEWLITGIGEMESHQVPGPGHDYQRLPETEDRFARTIRLMLQEMTDEQKAKVQQYAEDQKRLADLEAVNPGGAKKKRRGAA